MRYLTVDLNSGHYVDDVPLIHPLLRVGTMALIGGCFGALAMGTGAIAATLSLDATPLQGSPQRSSRPLPTSGFLDVPTDAPVVSDDGYILGAGDRLKLDFFSADTLQLVLSESALSGLVSPLVIKLLLWSSYQAPTATRRFRAVS